MSEEARGTNRRLPLNVKSDDPYLSILIDLFQDEKSYPNACI